MDRIYYLFGMLLCAYYTLSKPNGAPKDSCFYMTPRHIHPHTYRKVFPTKPMGLYNITTSADVFRPDRPIRVTLWGPPFKGFMLVAAEEGAKDWPAGIFYSEDGLAKRSDCLGRGDTVTHQNNSYKDSVSVLWYGPENMMSEQIQFIATVVVNLTIYYTNIRSGFLRLDPSIHGVPVAGGEGAPVAVTMDPWLAGNSVTQAPTNWWSQNGSGGSGGGRGTGSGSSWSGSSSGSTWGGSSGAGSTWGGGRNSRGGSSVWTEGAGTGGSWGTGGGTGGSWGTGGGTGGDWQQQGQGSLTSSNWGAEGTTRSSQWNSNGGSSWGSGNSGSGSSWGGSGSKPWGSGTGTSWGSGNSGSSSWGSGNSGSSSWGTGNSGNSWGTSGSNSWGSNSTGKSGSNGTSSGNSWGTGGDTWHTPPPSEGASGVSNNGSVPAVPSNSQPVWNWKSGKITTTTGRPYQVTASGTMWGNAAGNSALGGKLGLGLGTGTGTGTGSPWSVSALLDIVRRMGYGPQSRNFAPVPTKK